MRLGQALQAWREALGSDAVVDGTAVPSRYRECTSGATRSVPAVLRPASTAEVSKAVEIAARFRLPLHPISTGHNWGYGTALAAAAESVVVDLSRMCGIRDFDEDLGVITVEPGVTQGALAEFFRERDAPFLVPVTGAGPSCSILGNALERGYGITPISDHASAIMGIEAVLPDGSVLRPVLADLGAPDAARVFRWGVGPYLTGLFLQGGFGIVTSMTLALARRPESVKAFVMSASKNVTPEQLVVAIREVLRLFPSTVGGINLMNARRVLAMSVPYPRGRLGEDGLVPDAVIEELTRGREIGEWTVYGTLYGTRGVVAAVEREIRRLLKPLAARLLVVSRPMAHTMRKIAAKLPARMRRRFGPAADTLASSLELVAGEPNETALPLAYWVSGSRPRDGSSLDPARDGCGLIWYSPIVPMRPETVRRYLDFLVPTMRKHALEPLVTLTSLSERCFDSSVPLIFDRSSEVAVGRAHACYMELLEGGRRLGFMPYRMHVDGMSWLTRRSSVHWDVIERINNTIDPYGIVAPGRYCRAPSKQIGELDQV
ncbi:MAG TPA: FAD-binding oxidoreductase [Burkholderiales bacterium]|nr:FAD-binding oxidoreductase [Burkholderiales bacterium]